MKNRTSPSWENVISISFSRPSSRSTQVTPKLKVSASLYSSVVLKMWCAFLFPLGRNPCEIVMNLELNLGIIHHSSNSHKETRLITRYGPNADRVYPSGLMRPTAYSPETGQLVCPDHPAKWEGGMCQSWWKYSYSWVCKVSWHSYRCETSHRYHGS